MRSRFATIRGRLRILGCWRIFVISLSARGEVALDEHLRADVEDLARMLEPASPEGQVNIDRGHLRALVDRLAQAAPALGPWARQQQTGPTSSPAAPA